MREFFLAAAACVLVTVMAGLVRLLFGPRDADRMMAAQLLGTGGIAVLVLAAAGGYAGLADTALVLAVLAAFVPVAFATAGTSSDSSSDGP